MNEFFFWKNEKNKNERIINSIFKVYLSHKPNTNILFLIFAIHPFLFTVSWEKQYTSILSLSKSANFFLLAHSNVYRFSFPERNF